MNQTDTKQDRPQQVFISYAQADKAVARRVADTLQGAGLKVWFDEWALMPGDSIAHRIEEALQASDILLVLLSPAAVGSDWVAKEWNAALSSDLRSRAVTVIPALIADCRIPLYLANRKYLDLRTNLDAGVRDLIHQLGVVPDIDFTKLDGRSFENLVSDLLEELGFSIERQSLSIDSGFDFVASFASEDPFGMPVRESWLVEVKLYRNQRVSLQALRQMVGYMVTVAGSHKGLVVTNSQLTSVATDFLKSITEKSGRDIRVIDGTELRALLSRYPQLVERHIKRSV